MPYISPRNFVDITGVAERSRSGNAVRKLLLLIRHSSILDLQYFNFDINLVGNFGDGTVLLFLRRSCETLKPAGFLLPTLGSRRAEKCLSVSIFCSTDLSSLTEFIRLLLLQRDSIVETPVQFNISTLPGRTKQRSVQDALTVNKNAFSFFVRCTPLSVRVVHGASERNRKIVRFTV